MAIFYDTIGIQSQKIDKKVTSWLKMLIKSYNRKLGAITYIFCSDEEILRINQSFLNHDYYTDIITFDYSEGNTIAGDLYISLETVQSNAIKFKTKYDEELRRVMIHGILHLCGYNDKTSDEKKIMRTKEDEALALCSTWNISTFQ